MNLIIFCHPDHNSHAGKALQIIVDKYKKNQQEFKVLDLYKMSFQSDLSLEELHAMKSKQTLPEDILSAQNDISKANKIIFLYPVWWYNMPAKLKGFMDRVFTNGFAYNFKRVPAILMFAANLLSFIPGIRYLLQPHTCQGHLKNKEVIIFRTYGGPASGKRIFGNIPSNLENGILRFSGTTKVKVLEMFQIDSRQNSPEKEAKIYEELLKVA